MRRFGAFDLNAWYKLLLLANDKAAANNKDFVQNLYRIREELIKLLNNSEANECFVCNRLRCRCPWSSSHRSSTLSCLTSITSKSCPSMISCPSIKSFHSNESITSEYSESSTESFEKPIAPPAYSLPKPEWKAKNVAEWIRASTSTPNNADLDKNFFDSEVNEPEITEDMFRNHNASLPQMDHREFDFGGNYLSNSVPNLNGQFYVASENVNVPYAEGNHIVIRHWPKTIWDDMTQADESWPANEEQGNTVQAFFRSFSEVAASNNTKGQQKGYSYF